MQTSNKSIFSQLVLCLLLSKIGIIGLYLFTVVISIFNNPIPDRSFPTSIPWIQDEKQCERTKRVWRDRECWDYEHSLMF